MTAQPPPVKPNRFDLIAAQVDQHAAERGIPSKQYPTDQHASREGEGTTPPLPAPAATPTTPMAKITLELPKHVLDAVATRAFTTTPRTSQRYVFLQALRAIGIDVRDDDMIIDRRQSPKRP